MFSDIRYARLE